MASIIIHSTLNSFGVLFVGCVYLASINATQEFSLGEMKETLAQPLPEEGLGCEAR